MAETTTKTAESTKPKAQGAKPKASNGKAGNGKSSGKKKIRSLRGIMLGRILRYYKKANTKQIHEALAIQEKRRMPIGQILVDLGYVSQQDIDTALAAQAGMKTVDLDDYDIAKETLELVPSEMAMAYGILPLQYDQEKNRLTVALKSPDNFRAMDDLKLLMGYDVRSVIAPVEQLDKRLETYYGEDQDSLASLVEDLAEDPDFAKFDKQGESVDLDEMLAMADDSKIKRFVNLVLMQAINDHAADIHMEPFEDEFRIRCRVDGSMRELPTPPRVLATAIVSRVKVMANLDIAEHRFPQDGRIELTVSDAPVDMRVAVLPTMFGESVVLRVLDRSNVSLDLDNVGMQEKDLEEFRHLINKPNGIVVVTGPTGSGKTTTLYAALRELNTPENKILTVEDPVEYDIEGLVQVQVNPDVGLTFGSALRSFLRQDPDMILVGETRDLETAQIAVESALTGHLVFTTLHTNDAPSTVARLLDLGIETFLLTATVEGVLAQRLVRTICSRCKEAYEPDQEELMKLRLGPEDIKGRTFHRGRGCDLCHQSGYKGRMAIFEIMAMDDSLRDLIGNNASTQQLRQQALKNGMRTLRDSGLKAIYEGKTTIYEVAKETVSEED